MLPMASLIPIMSQAKRLISYRSARHAQRDVVVFRATSSPHHSIHFGLYFEIIRMSSNEPCFHSLSVGVVGVHWLISSSEVPFLRTCFRERPHGTRRKQHNATHIINTTNRHFTSAWRCSFSLPSSLDTSLHSGVRQSLFERS